MSSSVLNQAGGKNEDGGKGTLNVEVGAGPRSGAKSIRDYVFMEYPLDGGSGYSGVSVLVCNHSH